MNVSLNWLKEYVELGDDVTVKEVVDRMTLSGSKVEKFDKFGEPTTKVYVGKVENIEKHPSDDRTNILTLDLGLDRKYRAIAKIPDVEIDELIPVALPGAKVIGKEIKAGEVNGVMSECMVCHIHDFGLDQKEFPWVKPSGLISFPNDVKVGDDVSKVLGLGDYVIEFEITPNRPDCLSVEGLARELAVTFDKGYKKLFQEIEPDFNTVDKVENTGVKINTGSCKRYILNGCKNVKVEPSPYDIQLKLFKSKIRPINNMVDISNYVMLEVGQPLHIFDANMIKENIVVRNSNPGEEIETLDGVKRKLDTNDIVIADEQKALAIAGVMGADSSGVNDNTTNIFIESANFVRGNIRNTAKAQVLRSEASQRFEKGLPQELAIRAVNRVVYILENVYKYEVSRDIVDNYTNRQKLIQIILDYDKINSIIGSNISIEEIDGILTKLDFKVVDEDGVKKAYIPYYRQDVEIIEDIAEEVARIYGFDKIESRLPKTSLTFGGKTHLQKVEDKIKNISMANGYNEIYTYTFFSKDLLDRMLVDKDSDLRNCIQIINPLSKDFEFMRTSSLPLMLEALERNYTKKNQEVKLFEIGKIYLNSDNVELGELPLEKLKITFGMYDATNNLDFYDFKASIESLLNHFKVHKSEYVIERESRDGLLHKGIAAKISIGEDEIVTFGKLSPKVVMNYYLPENTYIAEFDFDNLVKYSKDVIKFEELPKFPAVERDIAFVVSTDELAFNIAKALTNIDMNIIEDVELFDVYESENIGKDKKSMAFRIRLRSKEKTLEENEINLIMEKVNEKLESEFDAVIRK